MDIREFKKWIIENHFEENDLFQEALICYNNRAYKAAYMFSYLAFTNYMRYLIIDYEGIPLQFKKQWNEKLSKDIKIVLFMNIGSKFLISHICFH